MEIIVWLMIFTLGLCVGSFVNMAVYRYAIKNKLKKAVFAKASTSQGLKKAVFAKASTSQSRSFCDYCGRQLRWYENVPVISWIVLQGKTKCCKKKLSKLYPLVELVTGGLFVGWVFNLHYMIYDLRVEQIPVLIIGFLIIGLMMFSLVVDLKYMILPDFSTVILIVLSAILLVGRWPASPLLDILSALGAAGFLGFLYLITKGKGMGFGDVKLALFMGLLLGFPKILVAFYVAFIVGAIVGVFLIMSKKVKRQSPIPFGPFLLLGTVVAWWGGETIIKILNF